MNKVKLEESENLRRLHIGSFLVDLNQSEYDELVNIFSNKKNNSQQAAFPTELKLSNSADKGLTKLEYFTAAALQGLLANNNVSDRKYIFESIPHDAIFLAKKTLREIGEIK